MIEINLLSPEQKERAKRAQAGPPYYLYVIPLVLGIFVLVHVGLALLSISRNYQLASLNATWKRLEPQRKEVDIFKQERSLVSQDASTIQQLTEKRVNWAQKLNRLSMDLPSGMWFSEISVAPADFILKCSVISLQKEEVALANKFLGNLMNDALFFKDFNSLELGPLKRKVLGGYEVVDFMLSGSLKSK
jgi:Tfp pilus assembly protein PilN